MKRDFSARSRPFVRATRTVAGLLLTAAALLPAGCADWTYDRIALGQTLHEYARVFPEDQTRRTTSTLCYLEQSPGGRTDAMVLLLTRDRRVSAKLHAAYLERNWGLKTETAYALRGELDPTLTQYSAAGPVDALRAVADELTTIEGDTFAREAHGWVAAGLVRLLQHWPHVGDEGPALPRLTAILERVPNGGTARITVDPRGAYLVEYSQGTAR